MILSLLLSAQLSFSDIKVSSKVSGVPATAEVVSDISYAKKGKGKGKGNGKGKGGKGKGGKGNKGGNKNSDKGGSNDKPKNCTTAQKQAIAVAAEEAYIDCDTLAYETYQLVQERYEQEVKKCQKLYDAAIKACR